MGAFINFNLLSPVNAVIVILILILGSYAGYALYSNAGTLTPKL
jgi:hypothetical protein